MKKLNIISVLFLALLSFSACNKDNETGTETPKVDLTKFSWGASMQDIQTSLSGCTTSVEDNLLFTNNAVNNCVLSYGFSSNQLQSVCLAGKASNITEAYKTTLLAGYTELGCLDDGSSVYVNNTTNTLLNIQEVTQNSEQYLTFGWTKLK